MPILSNINLQLVAKELAANIPTTVLHTLAFYYLISQQAPNRAVDGALVGLFFRSCQVFMQHLPGVRNQNTSIKTTIAAAIGAYTGFSLMPAGGLLTTVTNTMTLGAAGAISAYTKPNFEKLCNMLCRKEPHTETTAEAAAQLQQ